MDWPPRRIVQAWGLDVITQLPGRVNRHWRVDRRGTELILRGSEDRDELDLGYELAVMSHLVSAGWPVPRPEAGPVTVDGWQWCLFTVLPGHAAAGEESAADQRRRGRLLGELHGALAPLDLAQRRDRDHAVDVVTNPDLHRELAWYETFDADGARILRWHADRAVQRFEELAARSAPDTVLHGDFAPWNLFWDERGGLSGVLDFELTHRNLRVSDFALAWRGRHDQVICGYREVIALEDRELALIAPALWSWMLIGVARELRMERLTGQRPSDRSWIIAKMLRRTPAMGDDSTPYRPSSR